MIIVFDNQEILSNLLQASQCLKIEITQLDFVVLESDVWHILFTL